MTLRKSPSTTLTPTYHAQMTPAKSPDVWNSSPSVRTSSQLVNPSMLKRLPGKISPYRGLNHSPHPASQGTPTSKDRFPYMQASQPTKFSR
ncbi:hypothetical protein B566_EDAN008087 [Ephemera danica]|nr:hypothetical protein B566_EDAN008087 [Ephemera danica]